ncbi:transcription initiation at TATA-containing promoter protein [Conoideocrella luteorostrata]|uniref:Transcription initiation at TATA-containing promoter protein n=1 Tax=Conoideocrella luteorostrata TaxID=1105319 RepID=A0AAJ0CPI5_9HYPO|nr:transcription initiation at TATA-containing promoter protein [Conoideocrella luteorostrata]
METSGPDTPSLDPKPHVAVAEKEQNEQKTEVNGHTDDILPKPQSQTQTNSQPAPEASLASEQPVDVATEQSGSDAEERIVNGKNGPSNEQTAVNGADTPKKVPSESVLKAEDEAALAHELPPSRQTPETAETATVASKEPEQKVLEDKESTKPSEDITMRDSPSAPVATEPENKTSEVRAEESSKNATADTEMTDSPGEKPEDAKPALTEDTAITSQDAAALPTSEVDLGPAGMSQLAIETTEKESSPVEASVDVSMVDVPGVKVARSREDDAADDEPAPKRARTEPKDDEIGTPTPATNDASTDAQAEVIVSGAQTPGLNSSTLTKLSNWSDEETNKRSISQFQRREMRRVIGRVKKTKAGANFKDSVQKLWPGLWDGYVAKVNRPMDLAELERGLRDANGPYNTYGDFRKDLSLIFENALDFNGPLHDITGSAAGAVKAVWEEVLTIPFEEPAKPKALPKAKPVRESRAVANADTLQRQSAGPAASPAADAVVGKAAASQAQDQAADRRSSTATEGDRPKRTVRAPKPKDIDYTTKPSRKKLKPELQFADEVLSEIMSGKNHELNQWFMEPVDAEGLNVPDYYSVIKKPMHLNKVHRMLYAGEIPNLKEFDKTVRLIFDNCFKFNGPVDQGNPVSAIAKKLEDLYVTQMKGKDVWLAKYAKANAPASASNPSEDEDEDDEDDVDDPAEAAADNKEIEELQAKLDEETKKLNGMLLTHNPSMIDIQKNIVDMVQKTLISKAQEAQASRVKAKSDKPKKAGKGGKAKAAGSGGRKSTGGPQTKKSGGSKKAAPKKSLTAAEKDQIANGINDLEYPHLDRAIDIIKRDTGQNENNDGELELDIDQLSSDALVKLWELCRKALPGFAKDSAPALSVEVSRPSAKQSSKSSTAAKPKKNKPMSASEQEQRIAELTALSNLYRNPQEPGDGAGVTQAPTPGAESSNDSDSEEE